MKTIIDKVFGQLTYDYQWERPTNETIWGRSYSLLLSIESETDDDESVSKVQQDSYMSFLAQHAALEREMLQSLVRYCQADLDIPSCTEDEFLAHITPTSIFFPLSGGWAIICNSDFDEESGLAVVVRGDQIEAGSQDIIL